MAAGGKRCVPTPAGTKWLLYFLSTQALQEDGLLLLQTIGGNKSSTKNEPWIDKYIFPDSVIPSISQIGKASEELLIMEDWHNLGTNYEKTLLAWYENFTKNWGEIREKYDERFYRMWNFYLLSCAGLMRARHVHPWQIVFSKNKPTSYQSIR